MSDRRVLLTERHLEDIADAIREKRGSRDAYYSGEGVGGFDGATVAVLIWP